MPENESGIEDEREARKANMTIQPPYITARRYCEFHTGRNVWNGRYELVEPETVRPYLRDVHKLGWITDDEYRELLAYYCGEGVQERLL